MPNRKNVKLLLTDGRNFAYDEALVTVHEPSGALQIIVDDVVSWYSPGGWACLDYDHVPPARPQRATRLR